MQQPLPKPSAPGPVSRLARLVPLLCAAVLGLSACEEDVTAVLGTDLPFSIYGVLSPQLDSQWVRVFQVEDRLEPTLAEPLDAQVVSYDLTTGETFVWRDSLVLDSFGHRSHVFWAPFTARYGHAYRLEVRRSDGVATSVEVVVPPRTEVEVRDPLLGPGRSVIPVDIVGGAPRLLRTEVSYVIDYKPIGEAAKWTDTVTVDYRERLLEQGEDWRIPVDLRKDYQTIEDTLARRVKRPIDRSVGILLTKATLRLIVANDEWNPPGGVFDADVLVEPGVMENVENGFGFVGAGYRHRLEWLPPDEALEAAGFRTFQVGKR